MITRSNLAEQLREYQIRSKHDWSSVSFFTSTANLNSRVDVVISVIWELIILAFLVFSAVSLYFRWWHCRGHLCRKKALFNKPCLSRWYEGLSARDCVESVFVSAKLFLSLRAGDGSCSGLV